MHPVFSQEYSTFLQAISEGFGDAGVTIRPVPIAMAELVEAVAEASVDLVLAR